MQLSKKRFSRATALLFVIAVGTLSFTACSAGQEDTDGDTAQDADALHSIVVPLPNSDTTISCMEYDGYERGGLTCDWSHPGTTATMPAAGDTSELFIHVRDTPDGKSSVTCITFDAYKKGGVSCDWDHPILR